MADISKKSKKKLNLEDNHALHGYVNFAIKLTYTPVFFDHERVQYSNTRAARVRISKSQSGSISQHSQYWGCIYAHTVGLYDVQQPNFTW